MDFDRVMGLLAVFEGADTHAAPPAVTKPVTTGSVVVMPEVPTVRSAVRTETAPGSTVDSQGSRTVVTQFFMKKGIAPDDAVALVKRLAQRDAEWDDRRSCGECANLSRLRCIRGFCAVGSNPSEVFVLHRCPGFLDGGMERSQ